MTRPTKPTPKQHHPHKVRLTDRKRWPGRDPLLLVARGMVKDNVIGGGRERARSPRHGPTQRETPSASVVPSPKFAAPPRIAIHCSKPCSCRVYFARGPGQPLLKAPDRSRADQEAVIEETTTYSHKKVLPQKSAARTTLCTQMQVPRTSDCSGTTARRRRSTSYEYEEEAQPARGGRDALNPLVTSTTDVIWMCRPDPWRSHGSKLDQPHHCYLSF